MSGALSAVFANLRSFGGIKLFSWGGLAGVSAAQTGLNSSFQYSSPTQVGARTTWSNINCGAFNSIGIQTDGTVWTWGRAPNGQLGLNNLATYYVPVQVGVLTNWAKTPEDCCLSDHNAVIKTDGTLWTWGLNSSGQLGTTNVISRSSPVQVGALTTWSQVSSGFSFNVAIATNGTLWAWGVNNVGGQLGQTNLFNRSSPVQIGAFTNWSRVACGQTWWLATKTDGTLWGCGDNTTTGPLGQGNIISRSSPVQVGALTTWSQVACGTGHAIALKTDGTLWTWGENLSYQLAQGNQTRRSSPVQIGALTTWAKPGAGGRNASCINTSGQLWIWGSGNQGTNGDDTALTRSFPVQVGTLTTWRMIAFAGSFITSALQNS